MTTPGPILRLAPLSLSLAASFALTTVPLGAQDDDEAVGPRDEPADLFHPDKDEEVAPAYGGMAIIHQPGLPKNTNYMIENSTYARWMLYEMHEFLVQRDWEYWELEPVLCSRWETEDTLVLKGGRGEGNTNIEYGRVTDGGDHWLVTPVSPGHALSEPKRVPKEAVESVERETVFTFFLRKDVKWHDGHPFDSRDVLFSYRSYLNPFVDCDSVRPYYEKLVQGEVVDEHTIRFFYAEQYFRALETFDSLTILPSHLYDLRDPDHPRHDPEATDEEQGKEINESPYNTKWIGLGPYKLTRWSEEYVEAQRWDGYFDPENGGYLDTIRWRHIPNDDSAFQALINGELDFFYRIQGDDYFGEATQSPSFTKKYYKGYYYPPGFNYTPWNMRRPILKEFEVRKALAHAFDFEDYKNTVAYGLARIVTGPQFYSGPAYNHEVERFPYDLDKAEEILAEAGWYDRDGDGIIDKDGIPFEFEFQTVSGNKASERFAQKLQENLAKLGIRMTLVGLEWATYLERLYDREYDAAGLAWSVPVPESDPLQLWHSSGAPKGVRGSNHPGVADPYVDELIETGDRELDPDKRHAIWRELHRYLYEEVQPYLFRLAPPRKFGMNKEIRGFEIFKIAPNFSARRWYYPAGTPGTRSTRERN